MEDKDYFGLIFGKHLRMIRMRKGFSIEHTAHEAGVNDKNLGRIELGEKSPLMYTIFKLHKVLDFKMDALIKEVEIEMKENADEIEDGQ